MKSIVLQLADVKGVADLAKKANTAKVPLVVSLQEGDELVVMAPRVLEALLYNRAYLEVYSKTR